MTMKKSNRPAKSTRPAKPAKARPAVERDSKPARRNWGVLMAWTLRGMALACVLVAAAPSEARLSPGGGDERIELMALETPSGQYNAGIVLLTRVQNYDGAAKWLLRAAGGGHAPAQAVLGYLYAVGLGVPEDFVRAYAWLRLALPQLSGKLRTRAEDLKSELTNVLTKAEIAKAERISLDLKSTN